MTRLERILEEQLAPVVTAIDNEVRIRVLASIVDDLCVKAAGFEAENNRMRDAMQSALAALVAGDAKTAGTVLRGALR